MAQRIVAGIGADGRSTVVHDGTPSTAFRNPHIDATRRDGASLVDVTEAEIHIAELWAAEPVPTDGADGDPTADLEWTTDLAPGRSRWRLVVHGPNRVAAMHQRDSLDYDVLLAGELVLVLEDGEVTLSPGDCVVLPGVRHGWRSGPDGATLCIVQIGLDR